MFFDKIRQAINESRFLCLGIDPHTSNLPQFMDEILKNYGPKDFLINFGFSLIDSAVAGKLATVKIQMAFFESFGAVGWEAMQEVSKYASSRHLGVLIDGKRGDIASTMAAYGDACFGYLKADAMTIMPYMGSDSLRALLPWLTRGKSVYAVTLPSNASAEIYVQDRNAGLFAIQLASMNFNFLREHRLEHTMGFVVGASRLDWWVENIAPELSNSPLLMPGLGAQGARISNDGNKFLAARNCDIVPVSRAIAGFGDGHLDSGLAEIKNWDEYRQWAYEKIRAFKLENQN